MSLDQLIEECKKNDVKAQNQIYKLFASKLFSVCLKYSKNYVEAEDILQDTFLTVFKKIEQFKHKGSFEGWIKRIAINIALQRYRKEVVFDIINENQITDETIDIDESLLNIDFLLNIIQELPDRYRLVFNLYVMDDYSHKEIAEMLDITVGTSKSNLARARMILKEKVENYKASSDSQTL